MSKEIIKETFNVTDPAKLKVNNIRGSVIVKQGEENQIQINAIKHLDSAYPEKTTIEISQTKDGHVEVITRYEQLGFLTLGRPCKIEYEILTPKQTSVVMDTVSAFTQLEEIDGNHRITTVSGAVDVTNLNREFAIKTVSGKINGKSIKGPAKLKTVSGEIRMEGSSFSAITATTVSGNMIIFSALGDGPYRVNTVSGSSKLIVPENSSCSLHAHSISGRFRTNLASSSKSINRRSWDLVIGDGGTDIHMQSVSGNLSILTSENAKGDIPSTSSKTRGQRMDVLRKLEKGDLSLEETLAELN